MIVIFFNLFVNAYTSLYKTCFSTLTIESVFFATESKNSIFSADQFLICRWSKTSFDNDEWNSRLTLTLILNCRLFKICDINLIKSINWAEENSFAFSIWLKLKLSCSDMLMCLLCLILSVDRFSLIFLLLINFENQFSNRLIVLLNKNLSIVQFRNQKRECFEIFDVIRVRFFVSVNVDDLNWFNVISTNLFFVENDIKKTYWWSLSINSINSKIKSMKFLLKVRLFDWSF